MSDLINNSEQKDPYVLDYMDIQRLTLLITYFERRTADLENVKYNQFFRKLYDSYKDLKNQTQHMYDLYNHQLVNKQDILSIERLIEYFNTHAEIIFKELDVAQWIKYYYNEIKKNKKNSEAIMQKLIDCTQPFGIEIQLKSDNERLNLLSNEFINSVSDIFIIK